MIAFPAGAKVWLAGGATDMRCGMNSLALKVQEGLGRDPHAGEIFCFRGRRGDLVKLLWHDGVGMSLYVKRLEAGKFIWPTSPTGEALAISAAQLGYLLDHPC
jgi:transposase